MATQIFVNLPVKELNRSVEFFTRLGYKFDPQFTDENATCMIVGENIFVMLLVESFFKTFTKKEPCDATTSTEANRQVLFNEVLIPFLLCPPNDAATAASRYAPLGPA